MARKAEPRAGPIEEAIEQVAIALTVWREARSSWASGPRRETTRRADGRNGPANRVRRLGDWAEDEAKRAAPTSHGSEPDIFWRNHAMTRVLVLVFLSAVVAVGATLLATSTSTNVRSYSGSAHP